MAGSFFTACYSNALEDVPADIEIEYKSHARHAEWGGSFIIIDALGNVTVGHYGGDTHKEKKYKLSKEELLDICREIIKNNFFKLKTRYEKPAIDGGILSLRIRMNGKEHTVTVLNRSVKRADNIIDKIMTILSTKDIKQ